MLADACTGFIAGILTSVFALFTMGFNFFTPWIFWGIIILFLAGFIRGARSTLNVWVQAICVNFTWFIIFPAWAHGDRLEIMSATIATILPTAAGIRVRRARRKERRV
jgi:hypothetical protein